MMQSIKIQWFKWHSWLGVFSGLLMFIIFWGGTFATISHELDWLVNPVLRVEVSKNPATLAVMYDKIVKEYPDAKIQAIQAPLYHNFAAHAIVKLPDKQVRRIYINPYTLQITGDVTYFNLQIYFRQLHQNFFGLFGYGKYIVTFMSIFLLGILVSAIYLYKNWWQNFFKLKSYKKGSRSFWSSLHKLLGLWSIWFIVIMGVTGVWYLFEHTRQHKIDKIFAYSDTVTGAVKPIAKLDINDTKTWAFSQLFEKVSTLRPDLEIKGVTPSRGGYFYVEGQTKHLLVRDRANKVFLDPRDASVVYSQNAGELSPYWRWSDTADPLHFGSFYGLTSKVIWFIFGIFISLLSLTGTWLYIKRLQKNTISKSLLWASGLSLLIFVSTLPVPFVILKKVGPMVDGVKVMAEAPLGVTLFLSSWILLTLSICIFCFVLLFRLRKKT